MSAQPVSHGRGGAANIRPDSTPYTDGSIVREGPTGDQGDGKYSAGRGGAANIGGEALPVEAGSKGKTHVPHDSDMVPETAMRAEREQSHHVGRGGAGNEMHVHEHSKEGGGLVAKLKSLLGLGK